MDNNEGGKMTAKLIDLSDGARYRALDSGEVISISVSWPDRIVHFENSVVAGAVPISEFVHQVVSGSFNPV